MCTMFQLLQHTSMPVTISVTLLFSILFIWLFRKTLRKPNPKKNLPPSPSSIPIIGNLHQVGSEPHRALQTLSRRHGRDLMLLHFGRVPVVVVSSANAAREVMKNHDLAFSNRAKSIGFEKLLYNYKDVATAPYGEHWRQLKSICVLHLLSNKRVRLFSRVREEETKLMTEKIWKSCTGFPSNKEVNLSEIFLGLTNDVISRVALGRKYYSDGQENKFKKLFSEANELLSISNLGDFIPWLSWLSRVNGLEARMDKVAKEFDEFFEGVIEEHMEYVNDHVSGHEDEYNNFVDILLWIQRENLVGYPIDNTSIKAVVMDMFAAGTDTTYRSLENAMAELLRNPNAMKQLQNEVRSIVGDKTDVAEDDLGKMPYLKAVLKETLRLHPPVPLLVPRVSTQDAKVMGYDVVSGSQVFINAWAIGRDPASWGNEPEEFRPERFLDSKVDFRGHDFELIPFGAGRRGCPGISFAMAVNEIALANVVHKFDWAIPTSGLDMTETCGIALRRKSPLMAYPKLAK